MGINILISYIFLIGDFLSMIFSGFFSFFSLFRFGTGEINLRTSKMEVPSWLEDKLIKQGVVCM